MSTSAIRNARSWFHQAASDARTAEALSSAPAPMDAADSGCHVAAMCAQAIEKSLKGYLLLNGVVPGMDHRPDKYLAALLTRDGRLLQHPEHHAALARLFDAPTKAAVRELLDLTPGGRGNRHDVANTEYPWQELGGGEWRNAPHGAATFADQKLISQWLGVAVRVRAGLHKLFIAADRGMAA